MKYKNEKKQVILMVILLLVIILGLFGYQVYEMAYHAKNMDEWFQSSAFIVFFALLNSRLGSMAFIMIPIVLIFGCCYTFHEKYYGGVFEGAVLRIGYRNAILNELKSASKKALVFPGVMLFLFLLGIITGPGLTLDIPPASSFLTILPWGSNLLYQFFMVFFVLVCEWLFSVFVILITFLVTLLFKKFYLVVIYAFVIINIFNYLVGITAKYIESIIHIYPENVYELMMTDSIPRASVSMIFCLGITSVIFYIIYRNKDLVMLKHD